MMYTGGKDSSFLLYYLAKVCNLRVLACTWAIPYLSSNAKANIQAAKERLPNVEFIERTILPDHLKAMYQTSLQLQGNTCLCPSLAYIIFYPLLVAESIPVIISGVEEAQHKNMVINGFVSPFICNLANSKLLKTALNLFRVLTLRPPYKNGQLQTVTYLKQLVHGNKWAQKILGYHNEMAEHLTTIFRSVPAITQPLAATLKKIDRSGNIPVLVNIDFNKISPTGVYHWDTIKKLLKDELGWNGTEETGRDKGLHTSCLVEDAKDYSQFIRFRNMESMLIPFSAIELSTAVTSGNITREQAMRELLNMPGFSLNSPAGYETMRSCQGLPCTASGKLPS